METFVTIENKQEIALSLETAAKWFAGLDERQQAKFFSLCEEQFQTFDAEGQCYYIAKAADIPAKLFIYRMANFFKATGLHGKNGDDAVNTYPEYEFEME